MQVMIAARKEDRLEKAVREFYIPPNSPAEAAYIKCNIRQEDEVINLISSTLSKFGRLDYLVNNSGGQFQALAEDFSLKGWNAVLGLNLTGTFLMCREAYKQWMKANGGAIVNILLDFTKGFPFLSHSSAARAGVDNLTKSLGVEWASTGVRNNSVAPGVIYTDTSAALYGEEAVKSNAQRIPLKRLGTAEEIATAVCFLLSPSAAYITGETIKVDGGISLYMTQGTKYQSVICLLTVGDEKGQGLFLLSGPPEFLQTMGDRVAEILEGRGSASRGPYQGKSNKLSQKSEAEKLIREYLQNQSGDS